MFRHRRMIPLGPGRTARWSLAFSLLLVASAPALAMQMHRGEKGDARVRQDAVEHARKSCIASATTKEAGHPGEDAKINHYCSCFATRGLSKFSDAQLASLGTNGHFTPEQKQQLTEAAHQCRAEQNSSK